MLSLNLPLNSACLKLIYQNIYPYFCCKMYSTLKYLLLFVFIFSSYCSFAQDGLLPTDGGKNVLYTDSGKPDKSKEQLYKTAQSWITQTFGNYENAVTFQDPQTGKVIISSYVPVIHSTFDHIRFNLTVVCQENGYQASINMLDGIAQIRSPKRIGQAENDMVIERSMAVKTETNRKKKAEAELALQKQQADNEQINAAMYKLLAGLKTFMIEAK